MAPCKFDGCDLQREAKGYCSKHYYWAQRHGLLPHPQCTVDGCVQPTYRGKYCNTHYLRVQRHGDPLIRKKAANGEVSSQPCCVDGCERQGRATYQGRIYCTTHLDRVKRHGDPSVVKKLANGTASPERKKANTARAMAKYQQTPHGRMRSRFNQAKLRILKHGGLTSRYLSKEALLAVWNQPNCGICGEPVADEDKSLDHIIPISRGGSNTPDNWQLAHLHCNQLKSAKLPAPGGV